MPPPHIDDLLDALYRTALDPPQFAGFIAALAAALDATAGNVILTDERYASASFAFSHGIPEAALKRYAEYFWKVDQWRLGAERTRLAPGRVVRGSDLVDDETLLASEFYRDSLRSIGIFHWCGVILEPAPSQRLLVSVQRPRGAGPFPQPALDTLDRLKPHLTRVARIVRELAVSRLDRRMLTGVMRSMPFGVVFVRFDTTIAEMNLAAERILDAQDGLGLEHGRIVAARGSDSLALAALVERAVAAARPGSPGSLELAVPRPSGRRPYTVLGVPLAMGERWLVDNPPAAVLFMTDPEQVRTSPIESLQAWYGLTPQEARLAASLMTGASLADAAARLDIKLTTARGYLRNLFRKTGTSRQSELVRLLLSLPPG